MCESAVKPDPYGYKTEARAAEGRGQRSEVKLTVRRGNNAGGGMNFIFSHIGAIFRLISVVLSSESHFSFCFFPYIVYLLNLLFADPNTSSSSSSTDL